MTPEDDFHRLATGLRAATVDFDYCRTRKLLEPNWNGYDMPAGHDLINPHADLSEANIVTSQHRDNPDMHRIVLDLDSGVIQQRSFTTLGGDRLTLARNPDTNRMFSPRHLIVALPATQIHASADRGVVNLDPRGDYALIPSTTDGHFHLILDVNLPWARYKRLLKSAADCGIIEPGYAAASARRGFSSIRPPWIQKPVHAKTDR